MALNDEKPYVVVWNDAVDLRHLAASIVICVAAGLPVFLGAEALFGALVDTPSLAGGYALLAGLAACVLAAAVCARLFRPKRTFGAEQAADREAAIAELERMGGTAEAFAELPPRVRAEMAELGLVRETAQEVRA
ncbi:hypothetical protein [Amycolatopsis thermoflava]|uniref:hypothetical protein n=1 Tax=Amycolatopsis thermoflava TaxID=84480 RepID=UPI003F49F2A7